MNGRCLHGICRSGPSQWVERVKMPAREMRDIGGGLFEVDEWCEEYVVMVVVGWRVNGVWEYLEPEAVAAGWIVLK